MAKQSTETTPKEANETTPLTGEKSDGDELASAGIHQSFKDLHAKHLEFHGNALKSGAHMGVPTHQFHEDHSDGTDIKPEDAAAAHVFMVAMAVPFILGACILTALGCAAVHFSAQGPENSTCPFPLEKTLHTIGMILFLIAAMLCCTMAAPPVYVCIPCGAWALQICIVVMLVMTLMSYKDAKQCGETLWWACLIISNWPIALCVYACCSPFGQAKAAAFLGYKVFAASAAQHAPSYKATATMLKGASSV